MTLKKTRNLEDSRSALPSRLFGTAPVLDEYTVIYTASDLTELRTGSLQRTNIYDHIMMLCLETGVNCTKASYLTKLLNCNCPYQLSLE